VYTLQVHELAQSETEKESKQSTNKDRANKTTREDLLAARRSECRQRSSAGGQKNTESHRGRRRVLTPGESSGKIGDVERPSNAHLYDEQLVENNMRCYIQ